MTPVECNIVISLYTHASLSGAALSTNTVYNEIHIKMQHVFLPSAQTVLLILITPHPLEVLIVMTCL